MKLVCISDTHQKEMSVPEADILIHAGDWSGSGTENETIRFLAWMSKIRHKFKKIVVTPGNHDRFVEANPVLAKEMFKAADVDLLIDDGIDFEGAKIYGSPWSPPFGRWAFMADDVKRQLAFNAVPDDTFILVTHAPPFGQLDQLGPYSSDPYKNAGCRALLEAVIRVRPAVHIFGHIHEQAGVRRYEETLLVNASHMDEEYRPTNRFVIVRI